MRDIAIVFSRAISAAKEHRTKGSDYKTDEGNDEARIMQEFEKYSEVYEQIVSEANTQKQALRKEAAQLEAELRSLRNIVANKQIQNKNLGNIVNKELSLKETQSQYQTTALKKLAATLSNQLATLDSQAEKITTKVTSYGMEISKEKLLNNTLEHQQEVNTVEIT